MYDLPSMSYDANGNILALQRKGYDGLWLDKFAYTYNSGTNKLQMITNTANEFPEQYSYTYDANRSEAEIPPPPPRDGNVKTDVYRSVTYANYNNQNLPIQLTVNGVTVNYWYDAAGNRIRKIAGDIDEIYVLGISGQTEAVFTANGSLKFFNINTGTENLGKYEPLMPDLTLSNKTLVGNYLANNITAQTNVLVTGTATLKAGNKITLKPGFRAASGCTFKGSVDTNMAATSYYYVKDHLGSTRVTVDEQGAIASYDDYDPWGMQLEMRSGSAGSTNDKYKFTGKERDIETNYDYFGARYYDSRIGRWMGADPLADKYPSFSSYHYCGNNPIIIVDLNGMEFITEKDKEKYYELIKQLMERLQKLNKKINSLNSDIADAKAEGDLVEVDELTAELNDITLQRNDIENAQTELKDIYEDKEKKFTFKTLGMLGTQGYFKLENGVGIIAYVGGYNIYHELKHASDWQKGITKNKGDNFVGYWGEEKTFLDREVSAYQRQYSMGGKNVIPLSRLSPGMDFLPPKNFNDIDRTYVRFIYDKSGTQPYKKMY